MAISRRLSALFVAVISGVVFAPAPSLGFDERYPHTYRDREIERRQSGGGAGRALGTGLAIGAGAAILGEIIANQPPPPRQTAIRGVKYLPCYQDRKSIPGALACRSRPQAGYGCSGTCNVYRDNGVWWAKEQNPTPISVGDSYKCECE